METSPSRPSIGARKPVRKHAQERLDALLDATEALLAAPGNEEVSLAQIAEVADIPLASVYHFFPNATLHAAIMSVDRDAAVRAVLLTGADRSFMAGADISLFERNLEAAPATASGLIDGFHAMLRALRAMEKPVVAALQGAVAGGGFGLALACDLCVMADDAQLISAYSKLGTSPDGETTWSLTQLLGRRRALDVMWLNEPIGAAEAHRLGLVNRIVPPARLQDEALALAGRLAEGAPRAMARIKTLVEVAVTSGFDEQLDRKKTAFVVSVAEADFREGITAFFARRAPRFTGR